ncbi:cellulase family glycosylhydrolase [Dyadobacter psychrotolerans]|uniref:T9SS type A sorting domain-containing protein n=1 Tax=Dyadobacter psychrotolerans TaxID=2541721 RepID=A0A4R5DC95_9BACT|nr:cellulase family glycosylhydrolase [Dyadobacter psychrotolerans]TDE11352.1 T9SS type A sorting domain-containing protein [Dyadobacter psychrotolerans]
MIKSYIYEAVTTVTLCLLMLSAKAYDGSVTIISGGKNRSFIFHSPGTTVGQNLPVLFVFHGDNGSGQGIRDYTGFNAVSDANNFIAVYPNADDVGGWHRAIDQLKDVQFTSEMIDYFCSTYHIDASKVYATGHSAGGFMTYNLAVNLPGKVAAFAPVAANMYANNGNYSYFSSTAFKPVAICHIHGDADPTVAYPDPDHTPGAWNEWPLTHFSHYSCGKDTYEESVPITDNVSKLLFCKPNPGVTREISMIRIAGGGHGWPPVSQINLAQTIWDFVKTYSIAGAPSCNTTPSFVAGTIHTDGKNILGPCNEIFIPRGVNYSLADDWEFPENMDGGINGYNAELSAEIIKAKPNTVRIQWYANRQSGWKPYSISDLDKVVTRFRNAGIVSIIELHDVTCSDNFVTFNSVILPWWKQPAVVNLLIKHKSWVMVNLANEFGTVKWASNQTAAYTSWVNHYKNAISEVRNAGIQVPLIIDAPDCGQSLDIALQSGESLRLHDPLRNIIMSTHAYWYLDNAAVMEAKVQSIAAASFPVILGEVANVQDATGQCSSGIPAYKDLLQSCQNHNVGWLAWTWTDDWCNNRRITVTGNAAALTEYGNTIINDPGFGLKFHAATLNNACTQNPLPVTLAEFKATQTDEKTVYLQWKTAREKDFEKFILERSNNGKLFNPIASIDGKGEAGRYEYPDEVITGRQYHYRLIMVDRDESKAFSKIIMVDTKMSDAVVVYPSPASDQLQINARKDLFPCEISIFNKSGKRVLNQIIKDSDQQIYVNSLAEGFYIVRMNDRVIGKVIVGKK